MIENYPDPANIAPIRYHFMNAQDQARVDRDCEEVFTIENDILSPRQQIRLHFRCLVRGHKLGKLGWYFNGIRRALSSPILLAGTSRMPRSVKFKDSSRFVRQLSGI
jgi:hypothetical protein